MVDNIYLVDYFALKGSDRIRWLPFLILFAFCRDRTGVELSRYYIIRSKKILICLDHSAKRPAI
jgi:cytochrome c oxidase subunit IV